MKFLFFAILTVFAAACSQKYNPEITVNDLKASIEYLASDSLKGRKSGEKGNLLAARFIRSKFEDAGLTLLNDDGFQKFGLVTSAEVASGNSFSVNGKTFTVKDDFLPYAFSKNTTTKAEVIFAGYGLIVDKDTLKWDDFKDVDVAGKWVLALQGDPDMDNAQSPFVEFSTERSKALNASDKKAAGLLLVAGPEFSETDKLSSLFFDKNSSRYSIPVLQITRAVANQILAGSGETVESLETKILKNNQSVSLEVKANVEANVNIVLKEAETQNVVALLPGTDEKLKDEYLVVGAHYDHLGMGGPGSGSRVPDTIAVHNGADDNASGVATIIEIAEKMATAKQNRRSIIFVSFSAEELGLVGSKAFTANPPVKMEKIETMFNFDMVGRLDSANTLSIGGTKTAKESETLLKELNTGFQLAFSGEGIGPSDHASFYLQNKTVFFFSTGAHPDYHTPNDDAKFINYEGLKKVAEYGEKLIEAVANRDSSLTFQEAGAKYQRSRGGRFKVTFGIMPDYAGFEKRGMRVDAVTPGKPADKGGMKKGDIITAIEGKKVGNIYDYMNRLQTLKKGERVSVDIIRNNKQTVLILEL